MICVRMALFAEMMEGQPWTPVSLKKVEDLPASASPSSKRHFWPTLPTRGIGFTRRLPAAFCASAAIRAATSRGTCARAPSYANSRATRIARPASTSCCGFDGEIRMITPTDPEGKDEDAKVIEKRVGLEPDQHPSSSPSIVRPSSLKCYQLPTTIWSRPSDSGDSKAARNASGQDRAPADRSRVALEHAQGKETVAHMVGIYYNSRLHPTIPLVDRGKRADEAPPTGITFFDGRSRWAVLALSIAAAIDVRGRFVADALTRATLAASSSDVPRLIDELEPYRRWAVPLLHAVQPLSSRHDLHREVALLRLEGTATVLPQILAIVPQLGPDDARLVAVELRTSFAGAESALWAQVQTAETPGRSFRPRQ